MLAACWPDLLRRFEPFAALEWTTFCSVARHARRAAVRGAAHAWRRIGRKHHGSCYLVKGVVRRRDKSGREQQIADQDAAARHALLVSGDGTSIETSELSRCCGSTSIRLRSCSSADSAADYAVERLDAARDDHWMHRFLGPGLVECLTPSSLQSVFRAFDPVGVRLRRDRGARGRTGRHVLRARQRLSRGATRRPATRRADSRAIRSVPTRSSAAADATQPSS